MGITSAVSKAVDKLREAFLAGRISEKKFRRREEAMVAWGNKAWAEPVKRPAAPSAGTRQNRRYEAFRAALAMVNARHGVESRRARRKIARAMAKRRKEAAAAA